MRERVDESSINGLTNTLPMPVYLRLCGNRRVMLAEKRDFSGLGGAKWKLEMKKPHPKMWFLKFGGESGIRTPDTRIMIPLL